MISISISRLTFALAVFAWLGPRASVSAQVSYAPYAITNLGGSPGGTFFFDQPYDVAVYNSTNIYVAATYDYTIRKITRVGGTNWVMSILAGSPHLSGTNDGVGGNARFLYPQCVTVDSNNTVYVGDTGNGLIRKITPDGTVTTLANGFEDPVGIAVNDAGTLYVSDYGTNTSIKIVSPGGGVGTLVSSAPGAVQYAGGLGLDRSNNVFVADSVHHVIYKISGGSPAIIAGALDASGSNDGIGSAARFSVPNDVAVNAAGEVFVSDAGNSTLRRIKYDGSNWVVKTIAGTPGVFGSASGTGAAASFRNLAGLVYDDPNRVLYAVDIVAGTLRAGVYVGPTNDFNSWTNGANGKWEDGANGWSAGVPSAQDMVNYITNAGTKAVVIDAATPLNSLAVNNVVVRAAPGDINGLALFNSGAARPLQIQENLAIDSHGTVAVTNGVIRVNQTLAVGYDHGAALLNLFNGAKVYAQDGRVGFADGGGNVVSINGPDSTWTNQNSFVAGYYSDGNGVLIENGAAIVDLAGGALGQGGNNNNFVVNGTGSAWRNAGPLIIGDDGGAGNALTIVKGASVQAGYGGGGEFKIGTGGDGNVVTVSDAGSLLSCSGPLRMTASVADTYNALYIGGGAVVTAPSLSVSNGNFVGLAGGTLQSGGTVINNGAVFPVGVGTEAATLRLNGGTHVFAKGLQITDHGVLSGCGTIAGPVTVDVGGSVLPDPGCAIVFTGPLTNNGTIHTGTGTNVVFPGVVVNRGSFLTNYSPLATCPTVVTGAIVNLADSATYTVTDGSRSAQFDWSLAGPGISGYVYATANTRIALAAGVTNVAQITNAAAFTFLDSGYLGPVTDAGANGGIGQFILLQHKTTGHYAVVRMDDVLANGNLNASWWFLSTAGAVNFGCVPAPPPPGPQPAAGFAAQPGAGTNLVVSFAAAAGRAYTVQVRTNLTTSPWISLTNIPGNDSSRTVSVPANLPQGYYRILTQ
jgi:T5SS/PEP-CTERM-associated repeat protein